MKILIIGAGLSGCALARLLRDRAHDVFIIEKKTFIGGLCITRTDRDGLKFEPFGARTFHTKDPRIIEFITRFDEFNDYVHRKGMIINGRLLPFPITRQALDNLADKQKIIEELKNRPETIDRSNFETACISIFGPTLYKYFIENYTRKAWGIEPKTITSEWAPKRLELREDGSDELFRGEWQGLPKHGYSYLLERIIDGIPVQLKTTEYDPNDYDVVVLTAPIDAMLHYKWGCLQYRSIKFHYQYDKYWEKDTYGTINLPQHPRYIRKCNFTILHKQQSKRKRIQYQEPVAADETNDPMYPVITSQNDQLFDQYLKEACTSKNLCPTGRLGLFKYLDMDEAIEVAFDMVAIVENYSDMTSRDRYEKINEIRKKY
jgi:UDP-galactopyranose mutase